MATLLLTAVGTAIGGPLGGALGALVGRQVDGMIFGGRKAEGPRLNELTVQTSSYGSPVPLHFGRVRAAGSVIWATDLVEHREKKGGGKGRPSITTYTYTASFAVAIASRPIAGIGRVWADGNLLRGEAGDLKVGGKLRIHTGHGDQAADSIIAQAEGTARCPAFRNMAYAVFEDLELADYGNRLPSLTFEVIADDGDISVRQVVDAIACEAAVANLAEELRGFTIDRGTALDTLSVLGDAYPISCVAWGDVLRIDDGEAAISGEIPLLPAPASASADSEAGKQTGTTARRGAQPQARTCALRYYDVGRDYQPGMQRGRGRAEPGDVSLIELPAALDAATARTVADAASRRAVRPGETAQYRVASLDSRHSPGSVVRIPGRPGKWRVQQWEWQAEGVNLDLVRLPPRPAGTAVAADSGRANVPADMVAGPTSLVAFELPWDGNGSGDRAALFAATSSPGAGWTGAALFALQGSGTVAPLGSSGRRRALVGSAVTTLPAASPLLLDRNSQVDIELVAPDQQLADADLAQLFSGVNRALLGKEIVQFASAVPVAPGKWRLSQFLRGRGGTEWAVAGHAPGEPFTLLDDALVPLDPQAVGDAASTQILASGLADTVPATSAIANPGVTLRPLAPVHGRMQSSAGGAVMLSWVRRARGAWIWADQVDAPLNEQAEEWEIAYAAGGALVTWRVTEPALSLSVAEVSALTAGGQFEIRQVGTFAKSLPLTIAL